MSYETGLRWPRAGRASRNGILSQRRWWFSRSSRREISTVYSTVEQNSAAKRCNPV